MKVTVEDISPVEKRLSVEIPPDAVREALDSAYRKIGQTVSIKGFRKGKVPRSVLERFYAPQAEEDVMKSLVGETLPKALEETDVVLILDPEVSSTSPVKPEAPFTYGVRLDLWPQFEPPPYKGIEVERPAVTVRDEEVAEQLEALRRHFGSIESVDEDRRLEVGDVAVIDYTGSVAGEAVPVVSEKGYYFEVGREQAHPEFDRRLPGLKRGEVASFEISYPGDAVNAKLAGKTVNYSVTLSDIKRRVLPDLDDAFAQKFGQDYPDLDALKARLRRQIESDKQEAVQGALRNQLLQKLAASVDFPVPGRLVEMKLNQMLDNVSGHLQEKGLDLEHVGMSEARLREKLRKDALFQVKTEIILDRIADAEKIAVENEDLSDFSRNYQPPAGMDAKQLSDAVERHVIPKLRAKKTLDFLLAEAIVRDVSTGDGGVVEEAGQSAEEGNVSGGE